jgi:hypothetical protein
MAAVRILQLAHAYHDLVLSFEDYGIRDAFDRARTPPEFQKGPQIYSDTDWVLRADEKDFFAGVTTRWFGTRSTQERRGGVAFPGLAERGFAAKLLRTWGEPREGCRFKGDPTGQAVSKSLIISFQAVAIPHA